MPDFAIRTTRRIPFSSELEPVIVYPQVAVQHENLRFAFGEEITISGEPAVILSIIDEDTVIEKIQISLKALNVLVEMVNHLYKTNLQDQNRPN